MFFYFESLRDLNKKSGWKKAMEASHVEEKDMNRPLRIGVLGAANIAPMALISPALLLKDSVQVRAIAARDPNRGDVYVQTIHN